MPVPSRYWSWLFCRSHAIGRGRDDVIDDVIIGPLPIGRACHVIQEGGDDVIFAHVRARAS